ncbi:MAG: acyl carrier protein [Myxococcaceae bacterium]|nr:acyl carrier protein [Myxococcaceae bacterium]
MTQMTRDEIIERIRNVLVSSFEIPEERVTLDARLMDDLELDSIDAIDMAVQIQEMTDVRVEEDELRKLRTVGDTVDLVAALLARKA